MNPLAPVAGNPLAQITVWQLAVILAAIVGVVGALWSVFSWALKLRRELDTFQTKSECTRCMGQHTQDIHNRARKTEVIEATDKLQTALAAQFAVLQQTATAHSTRITESERQTAVLSTKLDNLQAGMERLENMLERLVNRQGVNA